MRTKLLIIVLGFIAGQSFASDPYLAFSDLSNGPASGLNDNVGEGAIVTIWGANLGTGSANNRVIVTDSAGVERDGIVYYWKNADGALPSGPADLYSSHRFQEIAFSIPNAALGAASIRVEVAGSPSNPLPFTIRNGNIYHVSSSGSDSSGNGTWSNPWRTIEHAMDQERPEPGSIVYARGTTDGSNSSSDGIRTSHSDSSSTLNNQLAIVGYPNSHPRVSGQRGIYMFRTTGVVVSKLRLFSSSHQRSANGQIGSSITSGQSFGIATSDYGRVVGNTFTEIPGGCSSRFQGAIVGGSNLTSVGNGVDDLKIFGNEIYDYGCEGSSALHHTTYLTIRSEDDPTVDAWEWGWNYLHNNKASLGIHNWDKDPNSSAVENICGNVNGVVEIHDNVVVDQGGAGISVGGSCGWGNDFHIYNNVLINVGLAADWDGVDPQTSTNVQNNGIILTDGMDGSNFIVANNLIFGWNGDRIENRRQVCLREDVNNSITFTNNICLDSYGMDYVDTDGDGALDGENNVWFSAPGTNSPVPSWDGGRVTADPEITLSGGVFVTIEESGVLTDAGVNPAGLTITHDVYGTKRDGNLEIGPVEIGTPGPNPPDVR